MTTYILTMDNEFVSLEKSAAEAVAVIESGRANKLERASTINELEQILKRIKTGTEPKEQVYPQALDDLAEFFKRFSGEKSANQQKLKNSLDELKKSLDESKRILSEGWKDICQKVEDAFKS